MMRRKSGHVPGATVYDLSHLQFEIYTAIEASGVGMSRAELLAHTKRSIGGIESATAVLRSYGLIVSSSKGMLARWCFPGQEAAAIAHAESLAVSKPITTAKQAEYRRNRKRRAERRKAEVAELPPIEVADMPVKQTIVSASEAPPLRVRAARSVFELGAM